MRTFGQYYILRESIVQQSSVQLQYPLSKEWKKRIATIIQRDLHAIEQQKKSTQDQAQRQILDNIQAEGWDITNKINELADTNDLDHFAAKLTNVIGRGFSNRHYFKTLSSFLGFGNGSGQLRIPADLQMAHKEVYALLTRQGLSQSMRRKISHFLNNGMPPQDVMAQLGLQST